MDTKDVRALFEKASKIEGPELMNSQDEFILKMRRGEDGVKKFKRRALGICGRYSTKTESQMGQLLYDVGMVSTPEEGTRVAPNLVGFTFPVDGILSDFFENHKFLHIGELRSRDGERHYSVSIYKPEGETSG